MRATWTDLRVDHDGQWLFHDFSYAVPDGGIVGVVGAPAEGLSIALLALLGKWAPTQGLVTIVGAPESVAMAGAGVRGALPLDPLSTTSEAVAAVARPGAGSSTRTVVEWSLGAAGLANRGSALVGSLTDVELVRLDIAMAAAAGASVVGIDLSRLGDHAAADLWHLLRQLAAGGRLLIVAAAAPHEAMDLVLSVPAQVEVAQ